MVYLLLAVPSLYHTHVMRFTLASLFMNSFITNTQHTLIVKSYTILEILLLYYFLVKDRIKPTHTD
jgi:hypothetical protein